MGSNKTCTELEVEGSVSSASSFETASDPPKCHETISIFGESACGEPLVTQHLCIDFTPTEADNDFVQQKCVAFWDFVKNAPELQDFLVLPEPFKYTSEMESNYGLETNMTQTEEEGPSIGKTAVSMLEFVEDKGQIDGTFEAQLPECICSTDYKDYRESDFVTSVKPETRKDHAGSVYTKTICKELDEWDNEHPHCYVLHPLFLRFLTLWRHVQLVSDCITVVIWTMCCQWCCEDRMPLSSSASVGTKPSFEGYKFVDVPFTDNTRCCGEPLRSDHLAENVTPQLKGRPEANALSKDFSQFLNSQERLKKLAVQRNQLPSCSFKNLQSPRSRVTRTETSFHERNDYPTVHILGKFGDNGDQNAAFTYSCYKSEQ